MKEEFPIALLNDNATLPDEQSILSRLHRLLQPESQQPKPDVETTVPAEQNSDTPVNLEENHGEVSDVEPDSEDLEANDSSS